MLGFQPPRQLLVALLAVCLLTPSPAFQTPTQPPPPAPAGAETLRYSIEWRLITAGTANIKLEPVANPAGGSQLTLKLESAGLVNKLYRVEDNYLSQYEPGLCATSLLLDAQEGRRKRDTKVTYDRTRNKADYLERDLIKNTTVKQVEIDTPHCVQDIAGALFALRRSRIDIGKSAEFPVSDGKKFAMIKVESQEREEVKVKERIYKTIRYEAFLFNNVMFVRKASLHVWLTDDARKLPVQIRIRMNFPIGTITLTLDKEEHS